MTEIYDIANDYVERYAALNPISATSMGVAGHDAKMSDYSPDGADANAALHKSAAAALNAAAPQSERDRIARDAMLDEIQTSLDAHDAGEHLRDLRVLGSPFQGMRMAFDLMPRESQEDWRSIAARLALVPQGLAGWRRSLQQGVAQSKTTSRRQALGCAQQARVWTGQEGGPSFFDGLIDAFDAARAQNSAPDAPGSDALRRDLTASAAAANAAYADIGRWLADEYAPAASEQDGVGEERYALSSRAFNGIDIDFADAYQWGWEQLRWVETEMAKTAHAILPGEGVEAAKNLLESDPARAIDGVDRFQAWMQDLQDKTISELNGVHFDIPARVQRIEAMIAPPGGALAMYYTSPSEDFSRPGRTWYPTGGKTRFPLWGEPSIAYHEGVPGHHFERGIAKHLSGELSRFQTAMGGTSGYIEGWALYAERLMAELGYLENPDYYLGMLRAQALRSVRVIIDIGMHLSYAIPQDADFHPGEPWTPELGLEFIRARSHFPPDFTASEVDRYLGIPGQAISYKIGEREWLSARRDAERRLGAAFDLKAFHTRALNMGPMGLAQMRREMAAL